MANWRDSGVASLEFVLALPFIWIILILLFDFTQAFLERQRADVALRELALRHDALMAGSRGEVPVNDIEKELAVDTLGRRRMEAQFFMDRVDPAGTCPATTQDPPPDDSFEGGAWNQSQSPLMQTATSAIGNFLRRLSTSHTYEIEAEGFRIAGRLLPQPRYRACLVVDSNPWTIYQTGTPFDWLKSMLSKLGDVVSAFF